MSENIREIAGREAVGLLSEQIASAEAVISKVETKLGNVEATTPEEWDQIKIDLDRNIIALEGVQEMGLLNEEQKGLLIKMESQRDYLKRLEEERKGALPEAA